MPFSLGINYETLQNKFERGAVSKKTPIGLNIRQFVLVKIELLITVFPRLATRTAVRKVRTLAYVYATGQIVFCASITYNWCIGVRWQILTLKPRHRKTHIFTQKVHDIEKVESSFKVVKLKKITPTARS